MRTTGCPAADRQSPRHWSAVTNRTFELRSSRQNPTPGIGNGRRPVDTEHYVRHSAPTLLPLLPLTRASCCPQMVVTITLESDEAKRAARRGRGRRRPARARAPDRRPASPTVGTITQIESAGELPNGTQALVIRGIGRARIGSGVPGAEGALHVQVEPLDEPAPTDAGP